MKNTVAEWQYRVNRCEPFHSLAATMCRYGVLVFAVLIFAGSASAQTSCENKESLPSGGGTGKDSDPYRIETVCQLQAITSMPKAWYTLGADLDATGTDFVPIGGKSSFSGTFNGNNMTIRNLTINRPSSSRVGLFGKLASGGEIRDLNLVDVVITGRDYVGGLVGESLGKIEGSAVTGTVTGRDYVGRLVGAFRIETFVQLQAITARPGSNYVLDADIDAAGTDFVPIGGADGFSGTFDGNNMSISNLTINRLSSSRVGLFGKLASGGEIRNLNLVNVVVTGRDFVGTLVGEGLGNIEKVSVTGAVVGRHQVGGLVGAFSNANLSDCKSDVVVRTKAETAPQKTKEYLGGLVGELSGATVRRCSATGNLALPNGKSQMRIELAERIVGGLIGLATGSSVLNSIATGQIDAGAATAGGLIGRAINTMISESFASGTVTASRSAGGLIGILGRDNSTFRRSTVLNSYSTGNVDDFGIIPQIRTGGLISEVQEIWLVRNSYATGNSRLAENVEFGSLLGYVFGTGILENSFATGSTESSFMYNISDSVNLTPIGNYYTGTTVRFAGAAVPSGVTTQVALAQLQCPIAPDDVCDGISPFEEWSPDIWDLGNAEQLPRLVGLPGDPTVRVTVEVGGSTLGFTLRGASAPIPVTASVTLVPAPDEDTTLKVTLTKISGTVTVCGSESDTNCVYPIIEIDGKTTDTVFVSAGTDAARLKLSLERAGEIALGQTGEFRLEVRLQSYLNVGSGNKFRLNFQQGNATNATGGEASLRMRAFLGGAVR